MSRNQSTTDQPARGLRSRGSRARAAVRAFPLGVVALVVAAVIGTEALRGDAIDSEYRARADLLRARLAADPDGPLFLVVGSSRLVTGFTPETLPPLQTHDGRPITAFNMARTGSGPVSNHLMLARLFRDGVRPEWVLVELMPALLTGEDAAKIAQRCGARDLPIAHPYMPAGKLYPEYLRERTSHLPELIRRAWAPADPSASYGPLGGYRRLRDYIDPLTQEVLIREQVICYRPLLQAFRVAASADRAVRETVRLCRDHGAKVGFLMTPEGRGFREMYGPGCEQRFVDYVTGVGRELDVPVTDARDWLGDDDFIDYHHPFRRGATTFTARLARDVLGPAVAGW